MDKINKTEIINAYKKSENDTGSAEVQIALLTARINNLTLHLKNNKQDKHSERGLLQMIGKRRSLLDYLKEQDIERYREVIKQLEIRKEFKLTDGEILSVF